MNLLEPSLITSATLLGYFDNGSDDWHAARNEPGAIGGSDIGAIAGWNTWESPITKWAKKTGKISDEIKPSHRMRMGSYFEEPLLQIFQEDHPELEVLRTGTWANNAQPLNRSNPDGIAIDENGELVLLEVKFAGDNMTSIPLSYDAQMTFYEGNLGIKRGILIACAGSNYVELPHVFDQFKYDALCQLADNFREYIFNDKMPDFDGAGNTYETLRAMHPEIDSEASEELGELGIHLANAFADLQEIEKKYKELQSRTLDAMGTAKWGTVNDEAIVYRTARAGGTPYLAWKKKGN